MKHQKPNYLLTVVAKGEHFSMYFESLEKAKAFAIDVVAFSKRAYITRIRDARTNQEIEKYYHF